MLFRQKLNQRNVCFGSVFCILTVKNIMFELYCYDYIIYKNVN